MKGKPNRVSPYLTKEGDLAVPAIARLERRPGEVEHPKPTQRTLVLFFFTQPTIDKIPKI